MIMVVSSEYNVLTVVGQESVEVTATQHKVLLVIPADDASFFL